MSTATLPPMLADSLVQDGNDESLYEIVNGQRVELSMSIRSVWLGSRLFKALSNHVDDHRLGTVVSECLFILDELEELQRRPDLAFVSVATWPLEREFPLVGDWKVVPDLAVEIVSPNDLVEKLFEKIDEYFALGVKQVWVVSPSVEKVYVYESPAKARILTAADVLDGGALLPGFRLKIAELFHRVVNV